MEIIGKEFFDKFENDIEISQKRDSRFFVVNLGKILLDKIKEKEEFDRMINGNQRDGEASIQDFSKFLLEQFVKIKYYDFKFSLTMDMKNQVMQYKYLQEKFNPNRPITSLEERTINQLNELKKSSQLDKFLNDLSLQKRRELDGKLQAKLQELKDKYQNQTTEKIFAERLMELKNEDFYKNYINGKEEINESFINSLSNFVLELRDRLGEEMESSNSLGKTLRNNLILVREIEYYESPYLKIKKAHEKNTQSTQSFRDMVRSQQANQEKLERKCNFRQ